MYFRYKGRSHWWTGKIVQTRLDGTYDIQFGDILERHVPASLIRVRLISADHAHLLLAKTICGSRFHEAKNPHDRNAGLDTSGVF